MVLSISPPKIYQMPYAYLIRQQVLQLHEDTHRVLDGLVRGYGDRFVEEERFRGHEVAVVAAHEMAAREMCQCGYVHDTPLTETLEEFLFPPEVVWPGATPGWCLLNDLMIVAQKWVQWTEKAHTQQICWNRGRKDLFVSMDGPRTSRAVTAEDVHHIESRLYQEFTEEYADALEHVMANGVEFVHFAQQVRIELAVTVADLPAGSVVDAWVDPRGRLSPSLAVDPNGRSVIIHPHEFRRLL